VGGSQEGKWVVLEGLQPGEKVMVDGFQKLRPGAPVKPVPWSAPSGAAGPTAAPAAAAPASRPASAASQPAKS
jgi:membrane fusion protein (multidrug efflux system)